MIPNSVQAKAMRVASATIKKLSSETSELKANAKTAEEKLAAANKLAEARKLAMCSILDPEYITAIEEKTAQFAQKDLSVVKEALAMQGTNLTNIGETLSDAKIATTGNDLLDYIQEVFDNSKD